MVSYVILCANLLTMYSALLALMGGASGRVTSSCVRLSGCLGRCRSARHRDAGVVAGVLVEEREACLRRESEVTLSSSTGHTMLATPPATPLVHLSADATPASLSTPLSMTTPTASPPSSADLELSPTDNEDGSEAYCNCFSRRG